MAYPVAYAKNTSGASDTWVGQTIANNAYYQIQDSERLNWMNNDKVLTDIGASDLTIAKDDSGNTDFSNLTGAVAHLNNRIPIVISEDFVADAVLQERAFNVSTGFNSISGTSEHDYLYLKNPASSGRLILITHALVWTDSTSCRSLFQYYTDPVTSADGTALGECNTFIKTSPGSPSATAFKNPTVTTAGQYMNFTGLPSDSPSRGVNRWFVLDEDHEFLITVTNSVSNQSSIADLYWVEIDK